jgi:hypothetical protein
MKQRQIRKLIRDLITNELHSLLHDVTYRIGVLGEEVKRAAGEAHRITSGMLNLATPILDGFSFIDNSPVAGSVAWADCNVVFKGNSYAITNGNTADKYIYWQAGTTPTTFKTSATKPTLTDDDVLIAINDGGVHQMVIGTGRMTHGGSVISATIDSNEIKDGAILADKIAALAISEGKIASGAVTVNKLGSGAVTEAKLGTGAVTADKIGASAVTDTKINDGAVTTNKIGTGAVTGAKIGTGAVTEAKIGTGAVTTDKIGASAITDAKIGTGAVTTSKIYDGAIVAAKIGAGEVATDKLDVALHMLF